MNTKFTVDIENMTFNDIEQILVDKFFTFYDERKYSNLSKAELKRLTLIMKKYIIVDDETIWNDCFCTVDSREEFAELYYQILKTRENEK